MNMNMINKLHLWFAKFLENHFHMIFEIFGLKERLGSIAIDANFDLIVSNIRNAKTKSKLKSIYRKTRESIDAKYNYEYIPHDIVKSIIDDNIKERQMNNEFASYKLTNDHMKFIYSASGVSDKLSDDDLDNVCSCLILYNEKWFLNTYGIDINEKLS